MNIMSCHLFVNKKKSTGIFSCHDYYLSKYFVVLKNSSIALRKFPLCLKQIIDAEILHKDYFAMACY